MYCVNDAPLQVLKMSILPKADDVLILREKFIYYSLHPLKSGGKSIAFRDALGYTIENADLLIANIRKNVKNFPAEYKGDKGYGESYAVLMELTGENNKTANVMTAWLNDKNTGIMRLTSAYIKKRKDISL
jgi:hypothetical protein